MKKKNRGHAGVDKEWTWDRQCCRGKLEAGWLRGADSAELVAAIDRDVLWPVRSVLSPLPRSERRRFQAGMGAVSELPQIDDCPGDK